ncbi:hypothetical protein THAOC_00573 [Thalassiosira oceanica]|uniref:Uncharacterized protein n=1 Tax=Thalassiosira oceanica TaxID=159749 RepID=K0TIY3_THAOC|nr:hypothetical protein THAOC_00573 [Thalassiosira oceanica]|eukprot:EJK77585.1 hypothetical protein THAOC_00573 [Thalassiosira oceanica]
MMVVGRTLLVQRLREHATNKWHLELHIAGGGTALRKLGTSFLGFLEGDNVGKVAMGRLSMILDIVRSVTRTLATCLVLHGSDSRVFLNGTLLFRSFFSTGESLVFFELAEHRDIRRPPLAWLVSGRSLHRERLGPLASWPDAPVSERSLHRERPDPLASWPDAPYPSVFSDTSFVSAGESLAGLLLFFRGMGFVGFNCDLM